MEEEERPFWQAPSRPWLCFPLSMQHKRARKHNSSLYLVLRREGASPPVDVVVISCFLARSLVVPFMLERVRVYLRARRSSLTKATFLIKRHWASIKTFSDAIWEACQQLNNKHQDQRTDRHIHTDKAVCREEQHWRQSWYNGRVTGVHRRWSWKSGKLCMVSLADWSFCWTQWVQFRGASAWKDWSSWPGLFLKNAGWETNENTLFKKNEWGQNNNMSP